jgi:hypothetical protein
LGEFSPVGRLFTLDSFCEQFRNSTNNGATFSTVKVVYQFSQEMDWAKFWATFSQTHLVTLDRYIQETHDHVASFRALHTKTCLLKTNVAIGTL